MIKVLLAVVLLAVFSTTAQAQAIESVVSQEDLKNLVDRVYQAPANKFLSRSLNGPNGRGFRIVFDHKGKRYTVDHDWYTNGVQVWIRRSKEEQYPDVFRDSQMSGIVDSGSSNGQKIFSVEGSVGDEYQIFWQEEYNQMLSGLQKILGKK